MTNERGYIGGAGDESGEFSLYCEIELMRVARPEIEGVHRETTDRASRIHRDRDRETV